MMMMMMMIAIFCECFRQLPYHKFTPKFLGFGSVLSDRIFDTFTPFPSAGVVTLAWLHELGTISCNSFFKISAVNFISLMFSKL
jgi:hypothetical protein